MAIVNLTFAATRAAIKVARQSLANDPLFQPGGTGPSRSADTMVLDSWGYQVRDFPIVVIDGIPGKNRRMGFNDKVRPFFGVSLFEEPGGTQIKRTFDVPLALVPGTVIEVRYSGDRMSLNPPSPWRVPVQQKIVGGNPINFVDITGANVGPPATYPASKFEASTSNLATGDVYGGWYDLTISLTGCARSTTGRQMLADRLWSLMWFEKKKTLRKMGIVVLDVDHVGYKETPYGADQLYYTKFNASCATEFEAIVQFTETVQDVSVVGNAVSVST